MSPSSTRPEWHQRATATRRRRTEQRVLTAARALFESPGYAEVTVEQIAEAAGVGAATIYNRFGSKAGVGAVLFRDEIARLGAAAERDARKDTPTAKALPRHFTRLAETVAKNRELAAASFRVALEPGMGAGLAGEEDGTPPSLAAPLEVLLRAGQERGEVRPGIDVAEAAEASTNLFHVMRITRPDVPARTTARSVSELLLNGLLVSPARG